MPEPLAAPPPVSPNSPREAPEVAVRQRQRAGSKGCTGLQVPSQGQPGGGDRGGAWNCLPRPLIFRKHKPWTVGLGSTCPRQGEWPQESALGVMGRDLEDQWPSSPESQGPPECAVQRAWGSQLLRLLDKPPGDGACPLPTSGGGPAEGRDRGSWAHRAVGH